MTIPPEKNPPARRRRHSLASLGWRATSRPQQESVEVTKGTTWTVARAWSTPGAHAGSPPGAGAIRILLTVQGDPELRVGERLLALPPKRMIVLPEGAEVTTVNRMLWARCEWHLRAPALQQKRFAVHAAEPLTLTAGDYALLTTMTNVISTSPSFGTAHGAGILLEALSSTIMAAVLDATDTSTKLSPTQSTSLRLALSIIEERHVDSSFGVSRLVDGMAVSQTYLHRLFAATGTTPRRAIESRRVATATTLLGSAPVRSKDTLEDIAARSGFASVQTLQAALQRQRAEAFR